VKIHDVRVNYRTKAFEVLAGTEEFSFPFAKLLVKPTSRDRVREAYPDADAGCEAFSFTLESGAGDTVHLDAVREYNQDPELMNDLLLYRLTIQAREAVEESGLSKREMIRRLGTSPSQFYRLLDPAYYGKSIGQILALFRILGLKVDVMVSPAPTPSAHRPL
jgi:hypothetical protein